MKEIERKFKVKSSEYIKKAVRKEFIKQGFLNSNEERIVRVRIQGEQGYITVKGKSDLSGMTRFEWEKKISLGEACELLDLCEPEIIKKIRYWVPNPPFVFEVDEFQGNNKGLIVAEIELPNLDSVFSIPSWLGEEITGDLKYYNNRLSKVPYKLWQVKIKE